jgi:hypothetical protein
VALSMSPALVTGHDDELGVLKGARRGRLQAGGCVHVDPDHMTARRESQLSWQASNTSQASCSWWLIKACSR